MITEQKQTIPVYKQNNLFNYLSFTRSPSDFMLAINKDSPLIRINAKPLLECISVSDADWFRHILVRNPKIFPRSDFVSAEENRGLPNNIFHTQDWDDWLEQRKFLSHMYARDVLTSFDTKIVNHTRACINNSLNANSAVDFRKTALDLTLNLMFELLFSNQYEDPHEVGDMISTATAASFRRVKMPIKLPVTLPLPLYRSLRARKQKVDAAMLHLIETRIQDKSAVESVDLLDILIKKMASETNQEKGDIDLLLNNILATITAGYHTTAVALLWAMYFVATREDVKQKLFEEIDAVLQGRDVTHSDLASLTYLDMVVKESLRLRPPASMLARDCKETHEFANHHLEKGTIIVLNFAALHRNPAYWERPEEFWPEHFTPERIKQRHKTAYIPFSAGPQKCMGDVLAAMELRLVLATMLQALNPTYQGEPVPKIKPAFVTDVHEMPIRFQQR